MTTSPADVVPCRPLLNIALESWPVVVVTVRGAPPEAELRETYTRLTSESARRGPFALVIDASELSPRAIDAKARRMISSVASVHVHALAGALRAEAYVLPSSWLRGVLTAIHWLVRPWPWRTRVFATRGEAFDWCLFVLGNPPSRPLTPRGG